MRYFIGSITEKDGGMEYSSTFILAFEGCTEENAFYNVARDWRGGDESDWDEACSGFWSDTSLINIFYPDREIDEVELEVARKYLTVVGVVCE